MINTYRQTKTINELYELRNEINLGLAIQRSDEQWDIKRRSHFVYAMIYGYPTNMIFSIDRNGKMYQIIEGKQRFKDGIFNFINNQYALDTSTPNIEEEKLAGKTFSQLSEKLQKRFLNKALEIEFLKDPTDKEIETFFRYINNGVPLSSIQIIRVLAGETIMSFIREVNEMKFYQETLPLPEKSRRIKNTDEELIMKVLAVVLSDDSVGLSKDEITSFAIKLNEQGDIPEEKKELIRNITQYLGEAIPDKYRKLNKIHVPLLYKMGQQALELNIPQSKFGGWVQLFFSPKIYDASVYKALSKDRTADKTNITNRLDQMQKFFDENIESAPEYRKPEVGKRGRKPNQPTVQNQQPLQNEPKPNMAEFPSMSNQMAHEDNDIKQEFPPDEVPEKQLV